MIKINFITSRKLFQNSIFFITPLMVWKDALYNENISFKILFNEDLKLDNSDFIFIDSKVHRDILDTNFQKVEDDFEFYRRKAKYIFYCDTGDSSCWLEKKIFPMVDKYLKCQLLKNKNIYKTQMYGKKIISDFYYKNNHLKDKNEIWSESLNDGEINKLDLSWNIFFSNHNHLSSINYFLIKFFNKSFMFNKYFYQDPKKLRNNNFFIKFSYKNYFPTIGWQRKKILEIFNIENSIKINKFKYFNLMKNSKYCISPFGWGEIAIRDFESFVNGCILIKPNMEHIETWPNFYIPNITYLPIKWDLSDLKENLNNYLDNYLSFLDVAVEAQKIYRSYTDITKSKNIFVNKIITLIS